MVYKPYKGAFSFFDRPACGTHKPVAFYPRSFYEVRSPRIRDYYEVSGWRVRSTYQDLHQENCGFLPFSFEFKERIFIRGGDGPSLYSINDSMEKAGW